MFSSPFILHFKLFTLLLLKKDEYKNECSLCQSVQASFISSYEANVPFPTDLYWMMIKSEPLSSTYSFTDQDHKTWSNFTCSYKKRAHSRTSPIIYPTRMLVSSTKKAMFSAGEGGGDSISNGLRVCWSTWTFPPLFTAVNPPSPLHRKSFFFFPLQLHKRKKSWIVGCFFQRAIFVVTPKRINALWHWQW